jgi:hypothetical protein
MTVRAVLAAAWLGASGCTLVLDIEQARVDPTLNSGGDPDAGVDAVSPIDASVDEGVPADARGGEASLADAARDARSVAPPSEQCLSYCDAVMSFCVATAKQYVNRAQCLQVCALLPEGVEGGPDGNTAACRTKYALKAQYDNGSERDISCGKAGPGSDGTCGTVCDGYCALMMPTCGFLPNAYSSVDACLSNCRGFRDTPPYSVTNGALPDRHDAQCLLFHANSAVMDSDEHCEHAMGVTMCDAKPDGGP